MSSNIAHANCASRRVLAQNHTSRPSVYDHAPGSGDTDDAFDVTWSAFMQRGSSHGVRGRGVYVERRWSHGGGEAGRMRTGTSEARLPTSCLTTGAPKRCTMLVVHRRVTETGGIE